MAATLMLSGPVSAAPDTDPAFDTDAAVAQLRDAAEGDAAATEAVERLAKSPRDVVDVADAEKVLPPTNIPVQLFQVPAYSDTGQGGPVLGQLYGTGVATNTNNEFRFGFFGGPGQISRNQDGVGLSVVYVNLTNGTSGILPVNERERVLPTVISSAPVPGAHHGDTIVGAIYGNLRHDLPKEQTVVSTVWWPSLGLVLG
ncbi:Tat pathway signal protein [Rhodococcus sp. HNM0569]|uniref:Tat pathway signal protein n=1 Tax=Rhodococcus sp. HNM0569 TaxID=2716340 RepID=UPI003211DBA4